MKTTIKIKIIKKEANEKTEGKYKQLTSNVKKQTIMDNSPKKQKNLFWKII